MAIEVIHVQTSWEQAGDTTRIKMSGTLPYTGFGSFRCDITGNAGYGIRWDFVGKDANGNTVVDKYWYGSGTIIQIPTNTAMTQWLLWGKHSDDSAISPSEVEDCYATVYIEEKWYAENGEYPDYPDFLPRQPVLEREPFPLWGFLQDDLTNLGYPYLVLFPDLIKITLNPVKQREYITVYDMLSEKPAFLTNGLAILNPTEATIHEVINGEYSLTLTHPMDELGKWKYIRESNIVKCQGQLFTIKRVEWNHTSNNSGTVTAYCEHIFYQLNDTWIFADQNTDFPLIAYCKAAMDSIMRRYVTYDEGTMYRYAYDWDSSWESWASPWQLCVNGAGTTPVELLIGSGGIIDQKGGELYRNNFHFSINERMEGAQDNAFDLRFGANLCGLKRTVDTSTLALWLSLKDEETGAWAAVSYAGISFPLFQFPHNVVRSQMVRYDDAYYAKVYAGEVNIFDRMFSELFALWKSTCTPVICYELDVKDLSEAFPEISSHYQYKVGNSGRIYDELLGGYMTLKITETETDGITGEVKRITIGSKNSFTRAAGYPQEFDVAPTETVTENELYDSEEQMLMDSDENQIMIRRIVRNGN